MNETTTPWRGAMRDALRLVREGELRAATRAIQTALRKHEPAGADGSARAPVAPQMPLLPPPPVAPSDPRAADAPAAATEPLSARFARAASESLRADREPRARPQRPRRPLPADRSGLRCRIVAPQDADGTPRPLLVMLHGCKQDPEDFARGTRMDGASTRGWYVAYPEQTGGANPSRCWNWFRPQDQARGEGEPGAIMDAIDEIARTHAIDASRIYVAGLSAGAAMAVIVAARYPDRIAAVVAHSGLPVGAANNIPAAFTAMSRGGDAPSLAAAGRLGGPVPLLVFHGMADPTVVPANADRLCAQWLAAGTAARATWQRHVDEGRSGGRAYERERWLADDGRTMLECWRIEGAAHAWSGGDPQGSFADAAGPDASSIALQFFATHALTPTA